MILVVAVPLIYFVINNPKVGIVTLLIAAYVILWIMRMNLTAFPLGTIMDGILALLVIGFFIHQKRKPDWSFIKSPVSIIILVWISYNIFQVINPAASSRLAWLYTVRATALVMLSYFVFIYHIKTKEFIRLIIILWLGLGFFAALYAFKQEYIGFFPFEIEYIYSSPTLTDLLFIWGQWRKFSIFSDPVAFSYNMVACSLICTGLLFGKISVSTRILLICLIPVFLVAMVFSGTRGAYVLFPAAMVLLAIMHFNKKVLLITMMGAMFFFVLIRIPTSNVTLYRFQTAFKPTDDASFNVRAENQKRIQPYIQSHPIGGGLGSTGVWGVRFAPDSFLAKFPPDSGYVRVAVELGWIGLLIFCAFMFIVLYTGINNYYLIKDPELKSYCLAMLLVVFALNIGNYPQEALVQYPTNIFFYLTIALIGVCYRIDQADHDSILIKTIE